MAPMYRPSENVNRAIFGKKKKEQSKKQWNFTTRSLHRVRKDSNLLVWNLRPSSFCLPVRNLYYFELILSSWLVISPLLHVLQPSWLITNMWKYQCILSRKKVMFSPGPSQASHGTWNPAIKILFFLAHQLISLPCLRDHCHNGL